MGKGAHGFHGGPGGPGFRGFWPCWVPLLCDIVCCPCLVCEMMCIGGPGGPGEDPRAQRSLLIARADSCRVTLDLSLARAQAARAFTATAASTAATATATASEPAVSSSASARTHSPRFRETTPIRPYADKRETHHFSACKSLFCVSGDCRIRSYVGSSTRLLQL